MKQLKTRGVSFPALSLPEALDRARVMYQSERKNLVPTSVVAGHWGYGPNSSGGRVTVAALIHFDLLESEGQNLDRKVRLSKTALDALLSEPDSPEMRRALVSAVKSPKIYSEILSRWPSNELPSDAALKAFLLRDKDFNHGSVDGFIKKFRQSLSFAGLDRNEAASTDDPQEAEQAETGDGEVYGAQSVANDPPTRPFGWLRAPSGSVASPALPADTKQDVFTLDEGQVVLTWPSKMSKTSFEDLEAWIQIVLRKMARSVTE
jgi:hypothetical protein